MLTVIGKTINDILEEFLTLLEYEDLSNYPDIMQLIYFGELADFKDFRSSTKMDSKLLLQDNMFRGGVEFYFIEGFPFLVIETNLDKKYRLKTFRYNRRDDGSLDIMIKKYEMVDEDEKIVGEPIEKVFLRINNKNELLSKKINGEIIDVYALEREVLNPMEFRYL